MIKTLKTFVNTLKQDEKVKDNCIFLPHHPLPINWQEDFVAYLASLARPKIYVELGLEHCRTLNKIEPFADKLIGVDIKAECKKYMIESPKVEFVNMITLDYAKSLKTNPIEIEMLFIDADHSNRAVRADFKAFFPFVKPHGLILLHDGHPADRVHMSLKESGTAYKAIFELSKKTKSYEMVTLPFAPGLTICRKRKKQLSWQE